MEEVFVFSDEELHRALGEKIGVVRDGVSEHRPSPDPGTITMPEIRSQYNLSRDGSRRYIAQLLKDGTLIRDWVHRYDSWPPYKKKRIKGYRLNSKQLDKE